MSLTNEILFTSLVPQSNKISKQFDDYIFSVFKLTIQFYCNNCILQSEIAECLSDPCQNEDYCDDRFLSYEYFCRNGFTGISNMLSNKCVKMMIFCDEAQFLREGDLKGII